MATATSRPSKAAVLAASDAPSVLRRALVNVPTPQIFYVRMAIQALWTTPVCAVLCMPAHYVRTVIAAVVAAYPDAHTYVLESYRAHARLMMWRLPQERLDILVRVSEGVPGEPFPIETSVVRDDVESASTVRRSTK